MAQSFDLEKYGQPPFPLTYIIRERVIVEEHADGTLIAIDSEYPTISVINRPSEPLAVTFACGNTDSWRLIGEHTTGANGTVRINLSKFLNCRAVDYADLGDLENANFISSLPVFVATPQSSRPVFVTYEVEISQVAIPPQPKGQIPPAFVPNPALDVEVIVRSWNHDGTPAASIQFSWLAIGEKTRLYNP